MTFEPPKTEAGRIVGSAIGFTVTSTNAAWIGSVVTFIGKIGSLSRTGSDRRYLIPATRTFLSDPVPNKERLAIRPWPPSIGWQLELLASQRNPIALFARSIAVGVRSN